MELKTRVSAGTTGVSTGIPEYELNLAVSLLLQQELTARGYTVVMTRTENDVSISNAERAQIANTQQAGAFIRVHAKRKRKRRRQRDHDHLHDAVEPV